jgi:predicted pyridoxine 5'-phosphate oxidase superfamily flavin-nucleotide-binding protein
MGTRISMERARALALHAMETAELARAVYAESEAKLFTDDDSAAPPPPARDGLRSAALALVASARPDGYFKDIAIVNAARLDALRAALADGEAGEQDATLAMMEELLTEADDLAVEFVNLRIPDNAKPIGYSHPYDHTGLAVRADRLISRIRKRPALEVYRERVRARDEALTVAEEFIGKFSTEQWTVMESVGTATCLFDGRLLLPLRAALAKLRAGRGEDASG